MNGRERTLLYPMDGRYGGGWYRHTAKRGGGAAVPAFHVLGLLPGAEFSHKFGEAGKYSGFPRPRMIGRTVAAE